MLQQEKIDSVAEEGALRFERRGADRWPQGGSASIFRLSGDQFGRIHELDLRDFSAGGLGSVCPDPIEPGTTVSVGFADPGYLARRGVVRRCVPCGDGYNVAIQFELGLAA